MAWRLLCAALVLLTGVLAAPLGSGDDDFQVYDEVTWTETIVMWIPLYWHQT